MTILFEPTRCETIAVLAHVTPELVNTYIHMQWERGQAEYETMMATASDAEIANWIQVVETMRESLQKETENCVN